MVAATHNHAGPAVGNFYPVKRDEAYVNILVDAAVEAARTRLRPILMTSFAFILGSVPLVVATGAGAELRQALSQLRIAVLLQGYRGRPAADIDALLDAVMAVQAHVARTLPQELEINPLICTATGAVAADALIRTGEE